MRWALCGLLLASLNTAAFAKSSANQKAPTFNRDIAPIVFTECVACHHPGGNAPFALTTYREVKKRARLIHEVTADRVMPPWLPEPGHGDFAGARLLSAEQIRLLERWWQAGAPEGEPGDLKVAPNWSDTTQLGKPDLVVSLPEAYPLAADGPDEYRNFVIRDVVPKDRYLRAIQFHPGPTAAIHHAFVLLDEARAARQREVRGKRPGFRGMDAGGATSSAAMFMSWQPGKRASEAIPGTAAVLRKGSDLVLQLHMQPTGKPEKVKPSVSLYFDDQPPVREAFLILLRSVSFAIPAGAHAYSIESSYQLPIDVDVFSILPHLHYLGREVRSWAELPDGTRRELLWIKKWDFDWQGDYRYAQPFTLPKGTVLKMRCTYDNSAANPRNPNHPPKPVTYGPQSSDEMGELWIQVMARKPSEHDELVRDYQLKYGLPDAIAWGEAMVRRDPKDAVSRTELGAALAAAGRHQDAMRALELAVADNPTLSRAHHLIGQLYIQQRKATKAKAALKRAIELDPANYKAMDDLGFVLLVTGDIPAAIEQFENALTVNPDDPVAKGNLERARAQIQRP